MSLLLTTLGCADTTQPLSNAASSDMTRTIEHDMAGLDVQLVNSTDSALSMDAHTEPQLTALITSPREGAQFTRQDVISVAGRVSLMPGSLEFASITLTLNDADPVPILMDPTGYFETTLSNLRGGSHQLTLTARVYPDIVVREVRSFEVSCNYQETFDGSLENNIWTVYGDNVGVIDHWLELTNNQVNTWSNLVLTGFPIRPNELDISFDVSTGKCPAPGPCARDRINSGGGLAVSIWNVDVDGFDDVMANRMGHYLLSPRKLDASGFTRTESVHIEFDTYSNFCGPCGDAQRGYDGCTNPFTDPSINNHVELHFNGHAVSNGEPHPQNFDYCHLPVMGMAYADYWSDYLELDNNEWHRVRVQIDGIRVRVWMGPQADSQRLLIDLDVPGLVFKGGLLAISAGSGVNGNFHRLDNLQINAACN